MRNRFLASALLLLASTACDDVEALGPDAGEVTVDAGTDGAAALVNPVAIAAHELPAAPSLTELTWASGKLGMVVGGVVATAQGRIEHHASSRGVWLQLAKKGSGATSVTYPEALTVALTWGWIDGHKRGLDATHWLQKFTPRAPKSLWSKINRDKALALIASGAMQPAGP